MGKKSPERQAPSTYGTWAEWDWRGTLPLEKYAEYRK